MKNDSSVRSNFLDKANGATSILAIISAVAAFPGGLKLFQFLMDTPDSKIEPHNLTGLGDMTIPLLGSVIREPYASLVLFVLAVVVPVWILISLLVKKRGLGNNKIVGRGLYWFIIILGIGGILGGFGILTRLVSNTAAQPFTLNTDPISLAVVIGSVIAVITAWFAVNFLSQASREPIADQPANMPVSTDEIEERGNDRYVPEEGAIHNESRTEEELPAVERDHEITVVPVVVPIDEAPADLVPENSMATEVVTYEEASPVLVPAADNEPLSASVPESIPADVSPADAFEAIPVSEPQTNPAAPAEGPETLTVRSTDSVIPAEIAAAAAACQVNPVTAQSVEPVKTAPAENTVLKRKLIAFPGDDTKVIVIMREYLDNTMIREWAEIHPKSAFSKK